MASSYIFLQTFQKDADEALAAAPLQQQQGPAPYQRLLPNNIRASGRKTASGQDTGTAASQASSLAESKILAYRNQGLQNIAPKAATGGATYSQSPQERLLQLSSRNTNVQQQQQQAPIMSQRSSAQDRLAQALSLRKDNSLQQKQVASEHSNSDDAQQPATQNKAQTRSAQERLSQVQASRDAQSQQTSISSLKGQMALRGKLPAEQQGTASASSSSPSRPLPPTESQLQQSAFSQLALAANQARKTEAADEAD